MSVHITSIIGSAVDIPEGIDVYEISETLEEFCQSGYMLMAHEEEEGMGEDTLVFGKKGKFNIQGMYGGWFMQLEDFVNPNDFATEEEKQIVGLAFKEFLQVIPEQYDWLKKAEWSEINTYIRTFN